MNVTERAQARGIVITPAEAANEGVDHVLDKIQNAGANSVAVSPGVFVLGTLKDGVREPPLDLEGEVRTLDRPLWGKNVQYLKGYAPFVSDPEVWNDVPFPAPLAAPQEIRVDYAAQIIEGARQRGMSSYVVSSPTLLPGLPGGQAFTSGASNDGVDSRPVRIDGSTPHQSIAGQGCVNNPKVQMLARARLIDTFSHYSEADGLVVDWAEFTCYLPEDIFTCFCSYCALNACRTGFDWDAIKGGVERIWVALGEISDANLHEVIEASPTSIAESFAILSGSLQDAPAAEELFRFKSASLNSFFTSAQSLANEFGSNLEIGANGFAPPWHEVTGANFSELSSVVHTLRCKLFTFHWPMMTRWLAEWLLKRNPGLSPDLVLAAAKMIYQVPTAPDERRRSIADYGMPEPDQRHPITVEALMDKLRLAKTGVSSSSRLEAYVHSYRPVKQFEEILNAAELSESDGVWIQRYGYLSDRKLDVIHDVWSAKARSLRADTVD